MKKRGAIALPFNWMFAIIAGGIILFLAIYATTQFISTSEKTTSTETSAKIVSLLDPLETGLASGKSERIKMKKTSRIYLDCNYLRNHPFGEQTLAFSEKTFGDKFGEKGEDVPFHNKYIFAENTIEGKNFQVFSKPFFLPFKVADLIVMSADDYCFYQATNDIKDEIKGLGIANINFADDSSELENCTGTMVCFGASNCDINVLNNKVVKGNDEMYYIGDLVYPAIFSSSEIYECNLKRLMNKFNELSLIYLDKIKIIENQGCSSNIQGNLRTMMDSAKALKSSKDLVVLEAQAEVVDAVNQATSSGCKLY